METVKELEKRLLDAKNVEKMVTLQKELDYLKEKFQGKAFGTHTFERRARAGYSSARYYENFWIENMAIVMLCWSISFSRIGKNYTFSADQLTFTRSKAEIAAQNNGFNAEHDLIGSGTYGRKPVKVSKFMQLWDYGKLVVTLLDESYSRILNMEEDDALRIATDRDEKALAQAFVATGIDYVDITKDPVVFNLLKYCQLPFLQEQKYLPRIFLEKIIHFHISTLHKEKERLRSGDWSQLDKDCKTLENFIQKNKS